MNVSIVRASAADAGEILSLQRICFQSEAELYNDFTIPPLTQTLDEITNDFDEYVFLKALSDITLAGSVKGKMADAVTCLIGRLIVHPAFQNRGIGKRLVAEIERCFPGAKRFELATGSRSTKNIRLYEKLGYAVFKEEKLDDHVTFSYMEKLLSADQKKIHHQ